MDKKFNPTHILILLFGMIILLGTIFFFLNMLDSQSTIDSTTSEVPPIQNDETVQKDEIPSEKAFSPKETPSLTPRKITGKVTSLEGEMMKVSVSTGYDTPERIVDVLVNKETKFIVRNMKEQSDFQKEMQVFLTEVQPTIKDDITKIKELSPKPYTEKEVSINELKIGDILRVITLEEIKPETVSASAVTVTVDAMPEI